MSKFVSYQHFLFIIYMDVTKRVWLPTFKISEISKETYRGVEIMTEYFFLV